jgi:multidrug efflux pump subunit AcrB
MWIVRLALRRPYTFVVLSLMLFILAPVIISRTPTDIFPNINIPVVSVVWQYAGLSAQEMSQRIVYVTERAATTIVNNIEHVESQSMTGVAVVKLFFHPDANMSSAIAQVTASAQSELRFLPPGTTPPSSLPTMLLQSPFCSLSCPERVSANRLCSTIRPTSYGLSS